MARFPVTGIVGPRQVGKTTLAKQQLLDTDAIYLDLEKNSDINKLNDPELFFSQNQGKTIILDEIQHLPAIFPLLRAVIDENRKPGRFVILGSASPSLLRQSSESLAGRINYLEMTPLSILETTKKITSQDLWIYGGFPEPALSQDSDFVHDWYRSFTTSYIQQDLPQYGLPADPRVTRQFLMMIASAHGGVLSYSTFAKSLGLSVPTIKTYLGFLLDAFLLRELQAWSVNSKKRLIKSPKLYFRDTGMLHYLLGIKNMESIFGNIVLGSSWEAFVINQTAAVLKSDDEMYYYRTHDGAEIDLLIRRNNTWLAAAEIKFSVNPKLTKGTHLAMEDLGIELLHVVIPREENYPMTKNIQVVGVEKFLLAISG
ncbi:ATP-binding protein [Algoriphagus halophytocola]|uniref:ATP-binding protein n=2 Tax=Algoriphagus halophytocola TaxID=2991499 RepID=A0ABY6MEI0_9BACT|nr:ATP-binding protein [Algoriphagus sp. TR-M5]UZD22187.1 ATP-binding protein [Algoriphagus sp. TR-M5]